MSDCTCREDFDTDTGVSIGMACCESCASSSSCDSPYLTIVGLETIREALAEAEEEEPLWSDEEEEEEEAEAPLPMASIEFAAEAAAFAAKALPILEAYAAHHGMEAALAFGGRLSASAPAATMAAACQEIETSAKRNLEALSTAFGRDTATAWLDRELSSTGTLQEEKAKEEEKEKAWLRRASLMAMTGRGHY